MYHLQEWELSGTSERSMHVETDFPFFLLISENVVLFVDSVAYLFTAFEP